MSDDGFGNIVASMISMALLEDDLALVVQNVVVFQEVLADVEVARLDLFLGAFRAPC
jgi:Ni,Fe-hydrogenase maturation factor